MRCRWFGLRNIQAPGLEHKFKFIEVAANLMQKSNSRAGAQTLITIACC